MKTTLGTMLGGRAETLEERQRRTAGERVEHALRAFLRYERSELEPRGNGRYAGPAGILLVERHDAVLSSDGKIIAARLPHGYYLDAAGDPVFLDRGGDVADLDEREAAQRLAREEAREKRLAEFAAMPRRVVLLADLEGRALPTLQAAARILDEHAAVIRAEGDELVVDLGERLFNSRPVKDALSVLFAGRALVLAELARSTRKPLHKRLPDEPLRAGGGIA